jgi:hypothetical protein
MRGIRDPVPSCPPVSGESVLDCGRAREPRDAGEVVEAAVVCFEAGCGGGEVF